MNAVALVREPMTREIAEAIIGKLSKPSKMPWYSWSIPASMCKTGSQLHQHTGTVCSKCYARKGRYTFPNTQNALKRRALAVSHPEFVPAFVYLLNDLASRRRGPKRFRWFDSGDLQSLAMLRTINRIANLTPTIAHWVPTKEYGLLRQFLHEGGVFAPNLVVRVSHPLTGQRFKVQPMGLPYSTVGVTDTDLHHCPAPEQGGKCGSCSACWTRINVNYHPH
jgi:hypothetical protein